MSADNYGIVHKHGDGFGLSMYFASDERTAEEQGFHPYITAPTLTEMVAKADEEYFEYGWSYDAVIQAELLEAKDRYRRPYTWETMGGEFKRLGDVPTDGTWAVMIHRKDEIDGSFLRHTEARVAWGTGAHDFYVVAIPVEKLEKKR